jgi:hypothetical protein
VNPKPNPNQAPKVVALNEDGTPKAKKFKKRKPFKKNNPNSNEQKPQA